MEGTPIPPPTPGPDPIAAQKQVQVPAILLIVLGALGLIFGLIGVASHSVNQYGPLLDNPELPEQARSVVQGFANHGRWLNLPGIVLSGLMLLGGLKMKGLQSYALALTGAIVAVIPCMGVNGCCCIGMPVGIWALVVLMRPEVKGAFRG
ncbi:hypothetical protein FGE12_15625 [Aggregicoccus sp. 17bor-14]|uniref:hypothetical protein n=1 Tax=Myxococcaceae TaxID=31 RepID=UPI00129CC884|nr:MULTISPECIES: hypothetical protein [Myxococcaceae]MBF5043829.1 hypothetical protein [Simulacricoccus sp. 17bor-14]MRI89581.1 hypothetical protein [Aggregicoccus sp. 17bor-14]